MEKAIKQIEEDLDLFLQGQTPSPLRKKLKDNVDLRAARLIVFSLQWASVGYQSALRFAGAKLGQTIGAHFESREVSLILGELKKVLEKLKWGKIEIEAKPKNKKISLKIVDSLTSAGIKNLNQNVCFFEEGLIEGSIDGVVKNKGALTLVGLKEAITKNNVIETKCIGRGHDFCEFTINLEN